MIQIFVGRAGLRTHLMSWFQRIGRFPVLASQQRHLDAKDEFVSSAAYDHSTEGVILAPTKTLMHDGYPGSISVLFVRARQQRWAAIWRLDRRRGGEHFDDDLLPRGSAVGIEQVTSRSG